MMRITYALVNAALCLSLSEAVVLTLYRAKDCQEPDTLGWEHNFYDNTCTSMREYLYNSVKGQI